MKLNLDSLQSPAWQAAGIKSPQFDVPGMIAATKDAPSWLHLGAGNIFRSFIAVLQQRLLEKGLTDKGIIVAETYDAEIVGRVYGPCDNLSIGAALHSDAAVDFEVIACVAESLHTADDKNRKRLLEIWTAPSLQMVSLTITEKGYALKDGNGEWLPIVRLDMESGPDNALHTMSIIAAGLYARYQEEALPLALVSMDNCSRGGERLKESVTAVACAWRERDLVSGGFLSYLADEERVAFPFTMIDKITPRPSEAVEALLKEKGIENMQPVITEKGTFIAAFVNAERPEYLVVEDRFPAGRPPLEKAGVYMTDRDTVNRTERMKVATCLNPLHTAMSIFGCLLRYSFIFEEMQDPEILALVRRLGYAEGLPVVEDPKILSPKAFLDEIITERLPNPFLPDTPERIMTDTSQKVGIRFGETIKQYIAAGRSLDGLTAIPLSIAGWMRYLLGVDDDGNELRLSADPLKGMLQEKLSSIRWDAPESYSEQMTGILSDSGIFGLDLTKTSLVPRIEAYFISMLQGKGAVRKTLRRQLSGSGITE